MSMLVPLARTGELDHERRAALRHLADDVDVVARAARHKTSEARETLEMLRRRSVAVYRIALLRAAGVPDDYLWRLLSLTVAAFVANVNEVEEDPSARAAERRLRALAADGRTDDLQRRPWAG